MELDPTRTAIIAVHLQKDVVNADGAFGGFFAAQAVERDVVGVNTRLLDAARRAGSTVVYTRVAWQPGLADLIVNSPILQIVQQSGCLVEGSDKAQIVDELTPTGHRPGRHPPAGRWVLRQPTRPPAPQPGRRHRPVHRGRHQLLRRGHRPPGLRPGLPHRHRCRRLQCRRPRHPRRVHRLTGIARRDHHQRRGSQRTVGDRRTRDRERVTTAARPANDSALRRALRRARDGAALDITEASTLLRARGEQLTELCRSAGRIRDQGLLDAGRPGIITYSRKVFIPLTRLCRDRCHYCTFATTPGHVPTAYLERDEVVAIARAGAAAGCKEALFTLGDRPEDRWAAAREWLDERGYSSTTDYLRACAIAVLEETGLLPHLNPGILSWAEMARLKPVAPSMGLMLETTADRLFTDRSGPHYGSPDKAPAVRRQMIEEAGRLSIPFTTGILVGIGETLDRTGGVPVRDPEGGPRLRAHPGSHHPELPRQTGHRHGGCPRCRPG